MKGTVLIHTIGLNPFAMILELDRELGDIHADIVDFEIEIIHQFVDKILGYENMFVGANHLIAELDW
jgi:aspartyl aminopeptidase